MSDDALSVLKSLTGTDSRRARLDRIKLLEAVRDTGSISAAAKALGVTYKTAWDGVEALNNLFERPLISAQTGGKKGGGAGLTSDGEDVLQAMAFLSEEMARFEKGLEKWAGQSGALPMSTILRSFAMKTSARNALRCVIDHVERGAVNAEVVMRLGDSQRLTAIITNHSVDDLGLEPGKNALALIKSSFVILARADEIAKTSARNCLCGPILRREDGAVNSEIAIGLGESKTLTAIVTMESAKTLDLNVGDRACALIKASHIIVAVD